MYLKIAGMPLSVNRWLVSPPTLKRQKIRISMPRESIKIERRRTLPRQENIIQRNNTGTGNNIIQLWADERHGWFHQYHWWSDWINGSFFQVCSTKHGKGNQIHQVTNNIPTIK